MYSRNVTRTSDKYRGKRSSCNALRHLPFFSLSLQKSLGNLHQREQRFVIDFARTSYLPAIEYLRASLVRKAKNHHGRLAIQKRGFLVGTESCKTAAQSRYRFTLSSEIFARPAAPTVTKMSIIFGRVINQLARATSITGAH